MQFQITLHLSETFEKIKYEVPSTKYEEIPPVSISIDFFSWVINAYMNFLRAFSHSVFKQTHVSLLKKISNLLTNS